MRGDNAPPPLIGGSALGPPPHAWGQPGGRGMTDPCTRSTPTCVGTTTLPAPRPRRRSVHPHMRGDNLALQATTSAIAGPPPHAWGQPERGAFRAAGDRSTPTCVGTTGRSRPRRSALAVHPHMRGDNLRRGDGAEYHLR